MTGHSAGHTPAFAAPANASISIFTPPPGLNLPGLKSHDLTFQSHRDEINPFLVISLFDMTGPVFPPHPHAGFSVATYILPESEIGFWNQDTMGNRNEIRPGALHWSVAGAGLMHEETVVRTGKHALGYQIWIDHAATLRQTPPTALHLSADAVPTRTGDGVRTRVLVGGSGELVSPLNVPAPIRILDVEVTAGSTVHEAVAPGEHAFLWLRSGQVRLGDTVVPAGAVAFGLRGTIEAVAVSESRLTIFAAAPIVQEILPSGPFVATDRAELAAFNRRFQTGGMGRLVPFDQPALDRAYDAASA
jgi:redox-sensitive bicupin YhaK (pirin superfamily)